MKGNQTKTIFQYPHTGDLLANIRSIVYTHYIYNNHIRKFFHCFKFSPIVFIWCEFNILNLDPQKHRSEIYISKKKIWMKP